MFDVAIVGATGLVGGTLVRVLEERNFPVGDLHLFASERSEGKKIPFKNEEYEVEGLEKASFEGTDVAFFALSEGLTRKYVPAARKHCLVIDKSSVFRLDDDVPLVVPEVNPEKIAEHKGLIATPNCSTIPLVMILSCLDCAFGLKRVVVSTYQSASGAGRDALEEYLYETEFVALHKPVELPGDSPFPVQLADNVVPQIGAFGTDGYSAEEHKTMAESRKILDKAKLPISATCVRVPTALGHALAVTVDLDESATPKQVRDALAKAKGVEVLNGERYPTPIDARGKDGVFVGRIRKDLSSENGMHLWVVCDNLRKGAATNAVQIAELALKKKN